MSFNKRHSYKSYLDPAASFSPTRSRKFIRDYFGVQPITAPTSVGGYGDPAGTTGATNVMMSQNCLYEYNIKGAGQTLLAPTWDATNGLLISLDLTDDEGIEISAGIGALSLGSFTIGTDKSFYAKTQLTLADVSGTDQLVFGFRKNAAYATAVATYTDYAGIGIITAANPADVQITTRLNSGAAVNVDTTHNWADGETHTLEVQVQDNGYARFYYDNAPPTVTKTNFVFDSGDVVNWFLFYLHATTSPGTVHAKFFEFGYVPRKGE